MFKFLFRSFVSKMVFDLSGFFFYQFGEYKNEKLKQMEWFIQPKRKRFMPTIDLNWKSIPNVGKQTVNV